MDQVHDSELLKKQARNLRAALARAGHGVSHAQALELVAQSHGARDWNTARAAAARTQLWQFGGAVRGHYLGQPFTGKVVGARKIGHGYHSLTIDFDQPVDVARSALFQAKRRRVTATVGARGVSPAQTSDGQPHLVLNG